MSPRQPYDSFHDIYWVEIRKLREELLTLYRRCIYRAPFDLASKLFEAAYDDTNFTAELCIKIALEIAHHAEPDPELALLSSSTPRARCPLCGGSAQLVTFVDGDDRGFAIPEGLLRHLDGSRARRCEVMGATIRFAELRKESKLADEANPLTASAERDRAFSRQRKQLRQELKEAQLEQRREMADALKDARKRLIYLNAQIHKQTEFVRLFSSSLLDRAPEYPPTPDPIVLASENGDGLPHSSGIYFVWSGGIVVYVGQSVNLANRARSRNHSGINPGESLSWLPFERGVLNYAEAFYIGVHRPIRNFGGASRLAWRAATSGAE